MSKQNLTMSVSSQLGFYGKLPVLGDFVSRHLPPDFISSWDKWLQSAIACSKEELGEQWLEYYLTSPIWRFILSPGLSTELAWVGVMMPSVDRVGRYFPLTIALPVTDIDKVSVLTEMTEQWFDKIENIALDTLDQELSAEDLSQLLIKVNNNCWCQQTLISNKNQQESNSGAAKKAFLLNPQDSELTWNESLQGLNGFLLNNCLKGYSLWQTRESEHIQPSLLLCEGLPPINAYSGFLTGNTSNRGWQLQKAQVKPSINQSVEQVAAVELSPITRVDDLWVPNVLTWTSTAAINCGKRRIVNQDALLNQANKGVWVVADGMGGHQAGEIASQLIVDAIDKLELHGLMSQMIEQVENCLYEVNDQLRQLATDKYHDQIIGSTVVAVIAGEQRFSCLWAGDSRLYRLRENQLQQLTHDHCEELDVIEGLSGDGIQPLKVNNVITRAVGAYDQLDLDCIEFEPLAGDKYLLTSDGVDKELSPFEIERLLRADNENDAEILMQAVLEKEARDNISIIVIKVN